MPSLHVLTNPIDTARLAGLVFGGDLVIFRAVEPLAPLLAFSDAIVREALAPYQPVRAHVALKGHAYASRIEQLRKDFRGNTKVCALFQTALTRLRLDPGATCWDWLHLRIQPPAKGSVPVNTLGIHRDTWASNVYEQINWWTPLYPITAERTIVFYPAYWRKPIANTSSGWEIERVVSRRRRGGDAVARSRIVPTPVPSEPVEVSSELRVVIEPGDMLCFSGAHLHASVPNTSTLTRFSIEVRTVSLDDLRHGRRAPNIDGRAPGQQMRWFRRMTDGASIQALWEAERRERPDPEAQDSGPA